MDKPDVVYPDNGIVFGSKKDGITHSCYNMDEPNKCHAKGKKPDTKDIHRFLLYEMSERTNSQRQKVEWSLLGKGGRHGD